MYLFADQTHRFSAVGGFSFDSQSHIAGSERSSHVLPIRRHAKNEKRRKRMKKLCSRMSTVSMPLVAVQLPTIHHRLKLIFSSSPVTTPVA